MNYTDTQLSHRFIRFEVPEALDYDEAKGLVQQYMIKKLQDPETTGCLLAKLQEDADLLSQDGSKVLARGSIEETGARILTVSMVCNVMKETCYSNKQAPRPTREYFKSNFQFIDGLHEALEDYIETEAKLGVEDKLYYAPQKTSIGVQVWTSQQYHLDHSDQRRKNEHLASIRRHEATLSRWVSHFHKSVIQSLRQSAYEIKAVQAAEEGRELPKP